MRTYIRLFINLLFPLTLLFTAASFGYFTLDYSLSRAFNLGILSGVLMGISVSLIMALLLLIFRRIPKHESTKSITLRQPRQNPRMEKEK